MYFVHPQIQLSKQNITGILRRFFAAADLKTIKTQLSDLFPGKKIVFTDMARTGFDIIIEKMNLKNSDMLMPAYVCDIFLPILKKHNISPVLLDIDPQTFNLKISEIETKVSSRAKSILVPHIYGLMNNMSGIQSLAKKFNLKIIEDCAHCSGALPIEMSAFLKSEQTKPCLGNHGDAAMFSLYKTFPCFRGGILVCPIDWNINLKQTKFSLRDLISFLNCFPFWAYLFKKFGSRTAPKMIRKEKISGQGGINKISLNLFCFFAENHEKDFKKRIYLASLLQNNLKKIGFDIQDEKNNCFCYLSGLMPKDIADKRDIMVARLKKHNIFCARMWHTPFCLNPGAIKKYDINIKEFPNTLQISQRIINFPLQNFYNEQDIEKITKTLKLELEKIRTEYFNSANGQISPKIS